MQNSGSSGSTLKRGLETCGARLFGLAFRHLPAVWKAKVKQRIFDPYLSWRDVTVEATTYFGAKVRVQFPDAIQTTIFLTGVWEQYITGLISEGLAPGDIFVDVGANVGYYSLLASYRVGSAGTVFAFEASPRIYAALAANIDRNRVTNVIAINRAVSNAVGNCNIYMAKESNLGHSTIIPGIAAHDGHTLEAIIECAPLSALMPIDELLRARFIKIDIEGAERYAIEGLVELLPRFSDQTEWLIELSAGFSPNGQGDVDWLFETFSRAGYAAYTVANEYSDAFIYGSGGRNTLLPIQSAPKSQLSDVLFSRIR
jgi:FkbM family methyltransferase